MVFIHFHYEVYIIDDWKKGTNEKKMKFVKII